MSDIGDLKFVRIIDPNAFIALVGTCRHLFKQMEDMNDEKIDILCKYSSSILTSIVLENGRLLRIPNPLIHFAFLTDIENKIKGVLWAGIDIVEKHIFVRAFSLDKKYQSSAQAASDAVVQYLMELPIADEYKHKIIASTLKPKGYERCGWKRSSKVLMEYEVKKDAPDSTTTEPVVDKRQLQSAEV